MSQTNESSSGEAIVDAEFIGVRPVAKTEGRYRGRNALSITHYRGDSQLSEETFSTVALVSQRFGSFVSTNTLERIAHSRVGSKEEVWYKGKKSKSGECKLYAKIQLLFLTIEMQTIFVNVRRTQARVKEWATTSRLSPTLKWLLLP